MGTLLVTGSTGLLGRHLLPLLLERGDTVAALYRRSPPPTHERVIPIQGDISQAGDWETQVPRVDAVYHLAGMIDLSSSKQREVWQTNVEGTRRVLAVANHVQASHFYYVGTAFTQGRNPYELSKKQAEEDVMLYGKTSAVTIFKPSVIVGDTMGLTAEGTYGLYQVIKTIAWFHRRLEPLRQRVQGTLRLPPLELSFRITGEPEVQLDIVPVDWVAKSIAEIREPGVFWLTNPNAPKLRELAEWVGELLWLDIKFMPEFKASPVEKLFSRAAQSWLPYFRSYPYFTPSLDTCPLIGKEFIQKTAIAALLR